MMPAAKMLDPLLGIDFHLVQPPGGVPPVLMPHPAIGLVFDPFDLIPQFGADVWISGLPRAQAGSWGLMLPHFPIGGIFVKPPGNEFEVFMGSRTVSADDEALSYLGLPVLSCQTVGLPPVARVKGKLKNKPPKTPAGLVLPTSLVLAIPTGVFVEGPPTISLSALGFRAALGLAGKAAQRARRVQKGSKRWKALSERVHKRADALCDKLKLGDTGRNRVHRGVCTVTGHPVDVATGKVLTEFTDLELPGPLPLKLERVWYSTSTYRGPFGYGWHASFDAALLVTPELILYRTPDGRHVPLPPLDEGDEYFERAERFTFRRDERGYLIEGTDGISDRFVPRSDADPGVHVVSETQTRSGLGISFHRDRAGRLREIVDSAGRSIQLELDAEGRIVALTAPHPDSPEHRFAVARYAYDSDGNLASMTDALGHVVRYGYDGHLLAKETDRTGLSFAFEYDGRDERARCTRTWGDGGIYDHRLTYEPGVTTVTNSLGHRTVYEHQDGLVTSKVDARGAVTTSRYEHQQVVESTDALGRITTAAYDDRGHLVGRRAPDGVSVEIRYGHDRPTYARDARGGEWRLGYDEHGRLVERIDPLGGQYVFEWHGKHLGAIVDPEGQRTVLGHDAAGNLVDLVAPDGGRYHWAYDGLGRLRTRADPNDNQQHREYDLGGRIVRIQERGGDIRDFAYDGEGNLLRAKDRHEDVVFTYRGMGRLASRTEAGTTVAFEYDTEERLTAIINEHGAAYRFALDPAGDVVEEHGFDGLRRRYERDASGRVSRVLRPGARSSSFAYDAADRVVAITHSDGTLQTFAYDPSGDLVRAANGDSVVGFERDLLGRVVKEAQGSDWVASNYDALGLRKSMRSSKGVHQSIHRNAMGDVLCVETMLGARRGSAVGATVSGSEALPDQLAGMTAHFTRDPLGLEIGRVLPGGVHAKWHRDRLGRPIRQEIYRGDDLLTAKQYHWDANDRLKRVIDAMHGPIDYHHDELGSLARAVYAGSVELRMPDAVGNLFRTEDRSDRRYGPAGQLLEAHGPRGVTRYEYDPEGHLVRKLDPEGGAWAYEWTGAGMLGRVVRPDGGSVQFAYDALGRRLSKSYRGRITRWIWDDNVPLHEWVERDPSSREPTEPANSARTADEASIRAESRRAWLTTQPAQGPPVDDDRPDDAHLLGTRDSPVTWIFEPECFAPLGKVVGGQCFGIVTDPLGTPTQMFDAQGAEVWGAEISAYGEIRNVRGTRHACPFRWPGQYEDPETGLYYNRFRYLDPGALVYLSPDPLGVRTGLNAYSYVSDPTSSTDPLGLAPVSNMVRVQIQRGTANLSSIAVEGSEPITARQVERAMMQAIQALPEGERRLIPLAHGSAAQLSKKLRAIVQAGGISQGGNILREWLRGTNVRFDVENRGHNLTRCT